MKAFTIATGVTVLFAVAWVSYVYHILGFGIEGGFFPYIFRHTPFLVWVVCVYGASYITATVTKRLSHK